MSFILVDMGIGIILLSWYGHCYHILPYEYQGYFQIEMLILLPFGGGINFPMIPSSVSYFMVSFNNLFLDSFAG